MQLPHFKYHAPRSINTLNALIEKMKGQAIIMAGGTELIPRMKMRLIQPENLISILKIKELEHIKIKKDKKIEIGATVRIDNLVNFFKENRPFNAIFQAANMVGSQQIRNMATIGGNILQNTRCKYYNRTLQWQNIMPPCHKRGGNICYAVKNSKRCFAVYQGDMAAPLIVLNGKGEFLFDKNFIQKPLEDIFTGNGAMPFNVGKGVLIKFILPQPEDGLISTYKKYRIRDGMDFPIAGVAVAIKIKNKKIDDIKICLTGVSSAPVVIKDIKDFISEKKLTDKLIHEISEIVYNQAHPVENTDGDINKRRYMIKQMTFEAIKELIDGYDK
ncbi:MAG TPA: FAD binding domain-containing protein [Syntrophorhabdaceae bacterium]|nr:FAD binding domain-containing protein [Syntrophorhabdaceae bacterium]